MSNCEAYIAAPRATTVIGSTEVFGAHICSINISRSTGENVGPPTKIREFKSSPAILFLFKTVFEMSIAF